MQDIRWEQRFSNLEKAEQKLRGYAERTDLNELEEQGLIQSFEYTFELAWKTLQDYLKYIGYADIAGPRPVIELAFNNGLITDGIAWIKMMKARNLASHTYDEETAKDIIAEIKSNYAGLLKDLTQFLNTKLNR